MPLRNRETKLPIAPYFGLAYETCQDNLRMIGGINVGFTESLGAMVIFDGFNAHPLVNFSHGRHMFTFLLVPGRKPGLSYSTSC